MERKIIFPKSSFFRRYLSFRMEYGEGGPVRNRFAEREAEELLELKEQLERINSA